MTPSPTLVALELGGTLATNAVAIGPYSADNEVTHLHEKIRNICIEFNSQSPVADFVPSLQASLAANGVDSRVYRQGELPATCRYSLHYTAFQRWEKRVFGDAYAPCMIAAQLVLRENGKVLASSGYELGMMELDIWATTRRKIEPSVRAILAVKDPISKN